MGELAAGFVGALVGGLFTLFGTWWSGHIQRDASRASAEQAELQLLHGVVGALEAELLMIHERYGLRLRPQLLAVQDGDIFNVVWPVRHDYFTVYSANAQYLGRLPTIELTQALVRTYTLAKGMIDSLTLNAELIRRYEGLLDAQSSAGTAMNAKPGQIRRQLAAYAAALKQADAEFMIALEETLKWLVESKASIAQKLARAA